jgi:SAGA-associated factor 73
MRDKRAVIGRSRPYDELVIAYKKILDPEWEEPPKKETKAERKEKKDKEKAEKRKKELEERGLTGAGGSAGADGSIGAGANGDSSVKKKKTSSKKKKDANGATINGAGGSGSGKDSSGKGGPDVGTADGKGGTSSGPNATNGAFDDEDEDYDSEAEAEALIEAVQRARGLPTTLPFALSAHQLVSATQPLLPPATPLSAVAPLSSTTVTTQALPLPTAVVPYAHALGTPLARPIGASSFFVARNEALRCCSDIVRSALGDGVGVSAVSSNSMLSSGPSSASVIATPRSGVGW